MTIAPEGLGQADLDTGLDVVLGDPVAEEVAVEAAPAETESPVLYRNSTGYNENGTPSYVISEYPEEGRVTRMMFDSNGNPTSTVEIDRIANTHTMTIHQAIGDVAIVSKYAGPEGWVGYAPNIARDKK